MPASPLADAIFTAVLPAGSFPANAGPLRYAVAPAMARDRDRPPDAGAVSVVVSVPKVRMPPIVTDRRRLRGAARARKRSAGEAASIWLRPGEPGDGVPLLVVGRLPAPEGATASAR